MYYISNIDNSIHNINELSPFEYKIIDNGRVISILSKDGEEIDKCDLYESLGDLIENNLE